MSKQDSSQGSKQGSSPVALAHSSLRTLFEAGIASVAGDLATSRYLKDWQHPSRVHVLAIGKAADSMCVGALDVLDQALVSALVVTKHGHAGERVKTDSRVEWHESGHPVPDAASLAAGKRVTEYISAIPENDHLLVLISGGASALVEHLVDGETLATLSAKTEVLLASGAAIGEMNRQRRGLSLIKGGRLARFLSPCKVTQLLISDVPGDHLKDIGSGLLIPDANNGMPEDDPVWQRVESHIIASNAIAQAAVGVAATDLGLNVVQATGSLDGLMDEVIPRIMNVLGSAKQSGVYIWGGEPTVVLPADPGRGGRNQHLGLALAAEMDQLKTQLYKSCVVLVGGTDGTDGPTGDAGACVDHSTASKTASLKLNIEEYLERADAGTCLDAIDALVTTGPTGTNVMDLAVAIVDI